MENRDKKKRMGKNTNRLIDTDFEKSKIEKLLNLANIYWFKVNNRNTRKRCEICK